MPNFFFGCGGDDRSAAAAFDRKMNPYGASLNPMFGSDIGHFDVEDMCGILEEAHELVDCGLMSPENFRRGIPDTRMMQRNQRHSRAQRSFWRSAAGAISAGLPI